MEKRIGIMGAGAVGSYIGGFLSREGMDVTLIDPWAAHVDAIREHGLRVSGTQGQFTVPVRALNLSEVHRIVAPFDIVLLAVKSYDTVWATHFIKGFVSPAGVVVSAQNCMNDNVIASIVGGEREVGCVLSGIGVALWEPGHVQRGSQPGGGTGHDVFRVGERHGRVTRRVEELVEMLGCIDSARVTSNIWGERWSKLVSNASSNPVGAITGLGSQGVAREPHARLLQIQISKEAVRVGHAHSYQIEPIRGVSSGVWAKADEGEVFEELDALFQTGPGGADWRSSMAQDVVKGRRMEIEHMNGYIVDRGRDAGVPTPVNTAIAEVVKEIEAKRTEPQPANVERVLSRAGA